MRPVWNGCVAVPCPPSSPHTSSASSTMVASAAWKNAVRVAASSRSPQVAGTAGWARARRRRCWPASSAPGRRGPRPEAAVRSAGSGNGNWSLRIHHSATSPYDEVEGRGRYERVGRGDADLPQVEQQRDAEQDRAAGHTVQPDGEQVAAARVAGRRRPSAGARDFHDMVGRHGHDVRVGPRIAQRRLRAIRVAAGESAWRRRGVGSRQVHAAAHAANHRLGAAACRPGAQDRPAVSPSRR